MMKWLGMMALVLLAGCGQGEGGAANGAAEAHPGEQTYVRFCFSCHAAGIAGAPRVGSAADWEPRVAQGAEQMLRATIDGMPPGMPARGLCMRCTDEELAQAIDYMVGKSQ